MEQKSTRGGARPNSGRPRKDPWVWGQITCVLRRDTIQKLKDGCGGASKHFGQFLQDHLDEHPLPSRETYLFKQRLKAANGVHRGNPARERLVRQLKRDERARLRMDKMRAKNPELWASFDKIAREEKREKAKKEKAEAKAAKEAAKAAKAKVAA